MKALSVELIYMNVSDHKCIVFTYQLDRIITVLLAKSSPQFLSYFDATVESELPSPKMQ